MEKTAAIPKKWTAVVKALIVAYSITILLLLMLAGIMLKAGLTEEKMAVCIIGVYIISCFLGGFVAGKITGQKKFIWGLILGAAYFVVLSILSLIMNQEIQGEIGNFFTTMVLCIGSSMLGGMIS